jgi:nanoRNase/pAp phosphatase (c-di-AMP/oligoRNAs hydrolase)
MVILPHDNHDTDALASAATLRFIAKTLAGKDAAIALGGFVGRAENRAMVRYLKAHPEVYSQLEDRTSPPLTAESHWR